MTDGGIPPEDRMGEQTELPDDAEQAAEDAVAKEVTDETTVGVDEQELEEGDKVVVTVDGEEKEGEVLQADSIATNGTEIETEDGEILSTVTDDESGVDLDEYEMGDTVRFEGIFSDEEQEGEVILVDEEQLAVETENGSTRRIGSDQIITDDGDDDDILDQMMNDMGIGGSDEDELPWDSLETKVTAKGGPSLPDDVEVGETKKIGSLSEGNTVRVEVDDSVEDGEIAYQTEEETIVETEDGTFERVTNDTEAGELREALETRLEGINVPPEPAPPERGNGVSVTQDEFSDGEHAPNVDRDRAFENAQETIENGEMLGIGVNISKIENGSDYGPFREKTEMSRYDSRQPSVDVLMDTKDFSNLQAQMHTEYGTEREEHFAAATPEAVDEYAESMQKYQNENVAEDEKFPMPYVKLNNDGEVIIDQEGRHRALAALESGVEKVPVRVVLDP